MSRYNSHQSYAVPHLASLADLLATYHATGRASTALHVDGQHIHITLVQVREIFFEEPTGRVKLLVVQTSGAGGINRRWMRAMAARLGMRDCSETEHTGSVWSIAGVLSEQETEAAS